MHRLGLESVPPDCRSGVLPLHHNAKVQIPGTIAIHVHTQDQIWGLTSTAGHDSHIIGERSSNWVSYPVIYQYMKGKGAYPTSPTSDQSNFFEKFDVPAGT